MGNHTCPFDAVPQDPVPFYSDGNFNFKAHDVGWIICGFFTLISSITSFWLIWKHLTYYTCPQQQRHIIRMLFMVPIYSIVSLLSFIFYEEAIYFETLIGGYEAVVITSFFYLLLQYVGDTPAEQNEVFKQVQLKKWFWPLGFWKYRPDGLTFLWLMKIYILQYSILQPLCTLASVGLQYFGIYCAASWEPWFGHIYISLIVSISVSVAMYCIIQFYMPIQKELKPYDPVLKFLAVKSVVFLTFWQDSFLSILVYFGAIKPSKYFSTTDIQVGLDALLITFEMCIFGFLHIKAFTYLCYRPKDRSRTTKRWRAFLDVCDYRDWYYLMGQTSRYLSAKSKGRDFSLVEDIRREKYQHLQNALGRERWSHLQKERENGKQSLPSFWNQGCEPSKEQEEQKQMMDLDVEEKSAAGWKEMEEFKQPRGNLASRPEYDPENEDEDDQIDRLSDHQSLLQKQTPTPISQLLPTLPKMEVESIKDFPFSTHKERYPELSQYHHQNDPLEEEMQDNGRGFDQEETDIFVPRKGGRARKEASLGLGAFWRQFRQRISGSQEVGEGEESTPFQTNDNCIGSVDASNTFDQMTNEKDSNSSLNRIHNRDSPLTEIIQGRKDDQSLLIKETNSSHLPTESNLIQRQNSDRAYISPPPSNNMVPPSSIQTAVMPPVRQISLKAPIPRKPVGDIESVEPSLSNWTISQQPTAKLTENALALQNSSLSQIDQKTGSKSNVSLSTAELQRQSQTKEQRRSNVPLAIGPKGKKIQVVLPNVLSPNGLQDAKPIVEETQGQIPNVLVPGRQIVSSLSSSQQQRLSKIRFTEIKPPKPDLKDDPEAEVQKVNGWVIAGGKSLKQVREMEESLKRKQEEEKKEEERQRRQQWEYQQSRHFHTQSGNFNQTQQCAFSDVQPASSSSVRERRTSAPPTPSSSYLQQQTSTSNDHQQRSSLLKLMGKREKDKQPLPPPLPAPSQLSGSDVQQVLFGAMDTSLIEQQQKRITSSSSRTHSNNNPRSFQHSQSNNQIQVGSIVSRRDVFNAMASEPLAIAPSRQSFVNPTNSRMNHYPIPNGPGFRPIVQAQSRQSNPSSFSPPSAWPHPSSMIQPANSIGAYHSHLLPSRPPPPPSSGSRYVRQTMYDPYTGEPIQRQQQPRPPPSMPNSQRRPPQWERREGFHFDYID